MRRLSIRPSGRGPLSSWVWSRCDPGKVVRFSAGQGVDRLYVYVDQPYGAELARLRSLTDLAGDAGIELWAMSGEREWAIDHLNALSWQRAALATGLFVGTHLNVEPHTLPAWAADPDWVIERYIGMLEKVKAADHRPLHVDVPFWYGTFAAPGQTDDTLADAVLDIADAVTVMSYRDTATGPNSLSVIAADMLARAEGAGVPIELAVETNELADCMHCTFFEEGAGALRAVIDTVDDLLADHPTYTGFAVHDFDGFAALVQR